MVDDKKNIEKRIKMIKMTDYFKNRRRATLLIGVLCVAILSGVLLTNGLTKDNSTTRKQLQGSDGKDLRESSKSVTEFETLSNPFPLRLAVYPDNYISTMSSTPGIRILAEFDGAATTIEYLTEYGKLLTWDSGTGEIRKHGQKVELPLNVPVYWSSLGESDARNDLLVKKFAVNVSVFNQNNVLATKKVFIKFDTATKFYSVLPSEGVFISETCTQSQKPKNLDEAVSFAIKEQRKSYGNGEAYTEGHIILDSEEKNGIIKAYTLASFGAFGFENGIFTKISGSGSIPTVITFKKDQNSVYSLIKYQEPMDGAGNVESTKKMFPKKLWNRVLQPNKSDSAELRRQQEAQAKKYLISIGRNAEVSVNSVDKRLVKIDVEASNKLFAEYTKYDMELNNFPYWIGTKEIIQNGIRYIYETSQSRTTDGHDLVTFKKTEKNGTVIKAYSYKIVGHEPQLLNPEASINDALTESDKKTGLAVVINYFNAFAKEDYKTMISLSTDYHNKNYVHNGDVWGMKWSKAKEIKYSGEINGTLRFGVSVDMETVKASAQYPSKQTFFFVVLVKSKDGIWKIDKYTTG